MRFDLGRVREGMTALSTKGEKLGKVIRCDDESFVVEKGLFFRKDYELYYEYVTEARGGELIYALEDPRLARGRPPAGRTPGQREAAEPSATGREGADLKKP
jgi:hypothetical protein